MFYSELVTSINDYVENNFPTSTVNRFIEQAEQRIYNSVQLAPLRKNVTGQVTPTNTYLACPTDWLSTYSLACFVSASGAITTTSGSNAITIESSSGNSIQVGMNVNATGVPINTIVTSVGGSIAYLSANATDTGTVSATFQGPYTYLLNKDANFIREAFNYPVTTGLPQYYAVFGPQTSNPYAMTYILGPTPDQVYTMELHYNSYPNSIIQARIGSYQIEYSIYPDLNPLPGVTYYNVAITTLENAQNVPARGGSDALANVIVDNSGNLTIELLNAGTGFVVGDYLYASVYTVGSPTIKQNIIVAVVQTVLNPRGETWLGDYFDTALLNYALMEAITYIKGEQDTVALYQQRGDNALALLKQLGDAKEQGDAYRNGLPKYKVI
jgi:hypothetical protein